MWGVKSGGHFLLVAAAILLLYTSACGDPLSESSPDEVLESSNFVIEPRPNYQGAFWLVEEGTGKIIGYAPWDSVNKRWTLYTLKGQYRGFLQATLGTTKPPHYQQYLYYDGHNRYKGVYVSSLGGRPVTRDLPYGELGGSLNYYARGNIPIGLPQYRIEVEPMKRFPEGVDVSPLTPPPTR
jgi:hypothetical protein